MRENATRRRFMKLSGATAAALTVGAGGAAAETASWEAVTSPIDATLYDVESTARNAFAVGGGGRVVERTEKGWEKVVDGGPTGNGNGLYGSDVTDDGNRLWFAGGSGAIGEYDVETGNLEDFSAPNDVTNNFNDIAVTGKAGEANVYVAGDSGSVYYSFENGASGTWNYVAIGQGAAIKAIDFYKDREGYLVNGNGNVFRTRDGTTWNRLGIADADVSLYGIDGNGKNDAWVAGGAGTLFDYEPNAQRVWQPTKLGEPGLRDIEVDNSGDNGYAVGNGGAVFDLASGAWSRDTTPSGENLRAVVDEKDNDIAVGASGTIIETNPDAEAESGSAGGAQDGDAGRIARVSTETSGSKSLTFTLENVGDQSVTVERFALETDVQVETISRSGAEARIEGDTTGLADSPDGFAVDGDLKTFGQPATLDPGTTAETDFGLYDNGNVALTVDPADERVMKRYISATLEYGDGTVDTFFFDVTNVNS
jgi:hypothetical protein